MSAGRLGRSVFTEGREAGQNIVQKICKVFHSGGIVTSGGLSHEIVETTVKIYVVFVRDFSLVCKVDVEPGHLERIFFLAYKALLFKFAQHFRHAALGDVQFLRQPAHMYAFGIVDGRDHLDFAQMNGYICAEVAALPLQCVKTGHQQKQGKADAIVLHLLDHRIGQVVENSLMDTQFHVCFSGDFMWHAHYVWQPYLTVKARPAPLSALAARRVLA